MVSGTNGLPIGVESFIIRPRHVLLACISVMNGVLGPGQKSGCSAARPTMKSQRLPMNETGETGAGMTRGLVRALTILGLFLACGSASAQVRQAWLARYGGPGDDYVYALAVDGAGNVYVTGQTSGNDYGTIKYDGNGGQVWLALYDGPGSGGDSAKALAVDSGGNVYVTGRSFGSLSVDNDYLTIGALTDRIFLERPMHRLS